MTDYLEGYGVADARRERIIKWIIIVPVLLALIGGALYLALRTYPAKKQVESFLALLERGDYKGAYALWGCTEESPCRDYTLDHFMEDWGPNSTHPNAAQAQIATISGRSCGPGALYLIGTLIARGLGERGCDCGGGVIMTLQYPDGDQVPLWYERTDKTLGFSPWPACVPTPKGYQ